MTKAKTKKILICGTRKKGYYDLVCTIMNTRGRIQDMEIIEGCCPDSADAYVERWAGILGVKIHHFPSHEGNYLKRNIEMVKLADEVIAFWDGYSYGTAHTIAQAVKKGILVKVVEIPK